MTVGLKKHTRAERALIVQQLIPLVRRHLGANLIALAATGSFARKSDADYSDIELIGFVRVAEGDRSGVRFVYDGMAIDLWFMTETEYLRIFKHNVRADWPHAAEGALSPLLNEPFVRRMQDYPSRATLEDCRATLKAIWPQVQEATAKVLTAVAVGNHDAAPLLFQLMVRELCGALALLNATPFTTRSSMLAEARGFALVPDGFQLLVLRPDLPCDPEELERRARRVFSEVEALVQSVGIDLYETDLGAFVRPRSAARRTLERLKVGRVRAKLGRLLRPPMIALKSLVPSSRTASPAGGSGKPWRLAG